MNESIRTFQSKLNSKETLYSDYDSCHNDRSASCIEKSVNSVIRDDTSHLDSCHDWSLEDDPRCSGYDDDCESMSSNDTFYSETSQNDTPLDSQTSEDCSVNKTTLQYKTQLNHDRFHIPAVDPVVDQYQDTRDFLTVAADTLRTIEGKLNKDEIDFLNSCAGFDISSPSYHREGFAKLRSELLEEMKQYKKNNPLSEQEDKRADEVIKMAKNAKGLLPRITTRTGYSPGPNKDFREKRFCDENYEGPGFFDDPDDDEVNQTHASQSQCQCRSYIHHIESCPTPGQHCTSTECLSDDTFVFECICHPVQPLTPFNSHEDDTFHMKSTDPSYIIKMHNCLIPHYNNMYKGEKHIMNQTKRFNFHLGNGIVKKLERLYLKYFSSLPEKDLKINDETSACKEINLNTTSKSGNQLSYLRVNIGDGNFISKENAWLLADSGSMVNLLRESTLRELKIPTTSICSDTKYLLKTADGKRSDAALGTLKLDLFFTDQPR